MEQSSQLYNNIVLCASITMLIIGILFSWLFHKPWNIKPTFDNLMVWDHFFDIVFGLTLMSVQVRV